MAGWRRRCACAALALLLQAGGVTVAAAGAPAADVPAADAPAAARPRLPVEHFARLPLIDGVALAPDGRRFAALMNRGDDTLLVVRDLAGGPMRALLKTDNRDFRFAWFRWANDQRLVVSVHYPSRRGWTEVAERRLFSIRADGSAVVNLVRRPAFAEDKHVPQFQDQVIDWLPGDGQHVLMQLADDGSLDPAVYRVNLETARRTPVHDGRTNVQRWLTDATHRVRVGVRQHEARIEVLVCDPDGQRWRTAWAYEVFGPDTVTPLGFGADPNRLYVTALHEGRQAVFEVDLREPALPRRLLLSHPRFDIDGQLVHDPKNGDAVGIVSGLVGDAGAGFWQADHKALLQAIDRALPGRLNRLLQFSADGSRYLLHTIGNGVPGQYMVGFRDSGELTALAETYPELPTEALAPKQPVNIPARDGTVLPSYLTLPLGIEPARLPTVVLPHGGPISLDGPTFDPWVQFLANRGYAVLQVNFRGSAGFGHEHMRAGLKRWGLEMQDDLSDALQWLVARSTADPARVCIVGGSYGGFAALMGAAKTPGLYRCAVSFAGISDLVALGAHRRSFLNQQAVFERQVGSLWDDSDQLKATSPRRLAEKIQAPVLLVHGTADRNVPFEQSELMADALKRAGKVHRLVTLDGGDHGLGHQAHRLQFFRELEQFLDLHLRGGGAAAPAAKASAAKAE